jgi:hypothetical protein
MDQKRFQFTIARMLSATAWLAADLALFGFIKDGRGPFVPGEGLLLIVSVSGATCAIPGALAGKAFKWGAAGFYAGLAVAAVLVVAKLALMQFFGIGA